jgi:hypothetical protein
LPDINFLEDLDIVVDLNAKHLDSDSRTEEKKKYIHAATFLPLKDWHYIGDSKKMICK